MAGMDLTFDDVLGRKAKQKRQQEAAVLAQNLLEKGAEPDAINQIVKTYADTGQIKLPDYQTKMLPYDPNVPEGRSTRQPFSLDQKKKGLFGFDASTGKFTEQQTPEDMTDFEVKSYASAPKPTTPKPQGYTIYLNSQTGAEIRREANSNGKDEYIRITPPSAPKAGAGKDTPDVVLAKDTMKKYQAAVLKGDDIPDEFMDSVRSAADRLNIDMAEVQKDPGVIDSVVNAVSGMTGGKTPPASPTFKGTSPRFTPKTGKPLTADQAQQFLQQAKQAMPKGTAEQVKAKARELAKSAGYTF